MDKRNLSRNNSKCLILHLDGDIKYARRAKSYYNNLGLKAVVESISEFKQQTMVRMLLEKYKPNILVTTGHDLMLKKGQGYFRLDNYKNSKYFVRTVREARKWNRNEDEFAIIAGACESFFEAIMSEGANFASSPGRILIDYKDPLIIASTIAKTSRNEYITLKDILPKLSDGEKAIGGTRARGME